MKKPVKIRFLLLFLLSFVIAIGIVTPGLIKPYSSFAIGEPIDSLNGVYVYHNGKISNVSGRNLAPDNYNLGLKYQCVEFVKRYYYEYLEHKMQNSYGHAKDFFITNLSDGQLNKERDLWQYKSPGESKPRIDDLLVFRKSPFNKFGHVAIISKVTESKIEIIQQNPGYFKRTRETLPLSTQNGKWVIKNKRVVGWLRKEP